MKKHRLFSHQRTKDKQLLLIMKFFSLFLLIGIGNCLATNTYSQNKLFTIKSSQKTITEVFHEIEKNSEYIIFYMDQLIDTNRKVNINVRKQQVSAILDQLLPEPITLTVSTIGKLPFTAKESSQLLNKKK